MADETTLPTAEETLSDQLRIRRQKLADLKEAGKDPFSRRFLYALGVIPTCFTKARLKVRRVLKPTCAATSVTLAELARSNRQASVIRSELT